MKLSVKRDVRHEFGAAESTRQCCRLLKHTRYEYELQAITFAFKTQLSSFGDAISTSSSNLPDLAAESFREGFGALFGRFLTFSNTSSLNLHDFSERAALPVPRF